MPTESTLTVVPEAAAHQPPPLPESPLAFLHALAQSAPSYSCLSLLAGEILIATLKESPDLSAPYLFAAARHLPAEHRATRADGHASRDDDNSQSILSILLDVRIYIYIYIYICILSMRHTYLSHSSLQFLFAQAIGFATSQCHPRAEITKSGILAVLAQHHLPVSSFSLHPVHVEFLQACIFAEQYSLAESHVRDTWPRPSSPAVSITHVLRYYYLRGCVHMACGDRRLAVRCFWTCLSCPGNAVSSIQIAAWKKLVIVQCLGLADQGYLADDTAVDPMAFPKAAPGCVSRLIHLALSMQQPNAFNHNNEPEDDPEIVHMVEATAPIGDVEQDLLEAGDIAITENVHRKSETMVMAVYGYLAKEFVNVDPIAFDRLVGDNRDLFVEDGNLGMIQQCQQALIRRQIHQLSSVYSVIPFQRLSEMLRIDRDATRNLLVKMAVDHAWEIGIESSDDDDDDDDQGTTIVTLPPFPFQNINSSASSEMMELAYLVRDLDVSMATSSQYSALVQKENNKNNREIPLKGPKGVPEI